MSAVAPSPITPLAANPDPPGPVLADAGIGKPVLSLKRRSKAD